MTEAELVEEAVVVPRRAYLPIPDLEVIERPGWLQLVTPSFRQGGFNEIALAVEASDAAISAAIARYVDLGIRFRWTVGPDSAPGLAERLAARGLVHSRSLAMVRSTEARVEDPVVAKAATASVRVDDSMLRSGVEGSITVDRIDEASVAEYSDTMATAWNVARDSLHVANELALRSAGHRLYLARIDGEPAGCAGQVMFERSAYLLGGVVLPRFRGRGVYRALVATRLVEARTAGRMLATSQARADTSAPILERLGFRTVCALDVFNG